eukprot:8383332-Alexandrium_andersonii.AAC.1
MARHNVTNLFACIERHLVGGSQSVQHCLAAVNLFENHVATARAVNHFVGVQIVRVDDLVELS